jgi:glycerol uptake facilitator protein/aquaporin Z
MIVGAVVGVVIALLIVSPLGKSSGGHFNPGVSVSFWLMGALPAAEVALYLIAQLTGSMLGTGLARLIWGGVIDRQEIAYAVIQPHTGWDQTSVCVVEAGSIVVLMCAVACMLASKASSWTPLVVGVVIALLIALTGPWTGGSFNPARQFGPALLSGQTRLLWCYLVAPIVGAVLVGVGYRFLSQRRN